MRQVWFQVKQRKRAERKMGLKPPRLHCSSQERSTRLPGSYQATAACWGNSVSARNALALTPLPHSVTAWGEWGLGSNSGMDLKMQLLSLSVNYAPCNWQSGKQILMATKIPTRKKGNRCMVYLWLFFVFYLSIFPWNQTTSIFSLHQ